MSGESSVYSVQPTYHQYPNIPTQETQALASTIPVELILNRLDSISKRLDSLEKTVEMLKPKTWSIFTPTLSRIYSAMEEVASSVKRFLVGDGIKLLGAMVAVLTTVTILRQLPASSVQQGSSPPSYPQSRTCPRCRLFV